MQRVRAYGYWYLAGLLLLGAFLVWNAVLAREPQGELTVAFLNVGQGDAIYIEAPNGNQVLIDAGSGRAVLEELARIMPFMDRTIDTVIATHPDLDHIGGLPEVFARYDVGLFLEPGVADDGDDYQALRAAVETEGLTPHLARTGQVLVLDKGVYLEILFPDREVTHVEPNTASVVARLTYGDTSFIFTGDSPAAIEKYLVSRYREKLASNVLKLGHHGSKTSSTESFLGFVDPEYTVISAGCDNKYGHPHQEVVDRVISMHIQTRSTCDEGTILFTSDGLDIVTH